MMPPLGKPPPPLFSLLPLLDDWLASSESLLGSVTVAEPFPLPVLIARKKTMALAYFL